MCARDRDVHEEIEQLFFFFSFALSKLLHLIIHQKCKAQTHFPASIFHFTGVRLCLLAQVFHFVKCHNTWHTRYLTLPPEVAN
jgi:hypothetical protein